MHLLRFTDESRFDLINRSGCELLEAIPHPLNRTEKIHCCRTSSRNYAADLIEFRLEFAIGLGLRVTHAKSDTHSRRNANCRSAANNHVANRGRYLTVAAACNV